MRAGFYGSLFCYCQLLYVIVNYYMWGGSKLEKIEVELSEEGKKVFVIYLNGK